MKPSSAVLAKTVGPLGAVTLFEHAAHVAEAASALFGRPGEPLTRTGEAWLRFFGVAEDDGALFLNSTHAACWLHDLGKCNSSFQACVRQQGEQVVRHEHISALLLQHEPLAEVLANWPNVDAIAVVSAVLSHHLKASPENVAVRLDERELDLDLRLADESIEGLLAAVGRLPGAPPMPKLQEDRWDSSQLEARRVRFHRQAHTWKKMLRGDLRRTRLTRAVKAALIAADAAGSGLTRTGLSISNWIGFCFDTEPLTSEWLQDCIIQPVLDEFAQRTGKALSLHDWQKEAAQLSSRALLLSPCGSGKTMAAWLWIQNQLNQRPAARVIFLYPTRGTATEGFRNYASWAGGDDAALIHGTSDYDLQGLFANPEDSRSRESYRAQEALFALGHWNRRVLTATVDQFLSFLNCGYSSLCLLPLLVDSVVVIDEVHSFDKSMFSTLQRLLMDFQVPALCMTATLPADRMRLLTTQCGLQPFPKEMNAYPDLLDQAAAPRYRIRRDAVDDPTVEAASAAAQGKNVLLVANTVARCQEFARRLRSNGTTEVVAYHSRFRLCDRRDRHREAVALFRQPGGHILVSTQVCEMSLDLDADVLITELAPVPALIQRMGRCCRHRFLASSAAGDVVVLEPPSPRPYELADLGQARQMVDGLRDADRPVSQAQLAELLENLTLDSPEAAGGYRSFADSGPYAMGGEDAFRDTQEFTVDAVLDEDLPMFLSMSRKKNPNARGLVCPVPRGAVTADPRLPRGLSIAPAQKYDRFLGFVSKDPTNG